VITKILYMSAATAQGGRGGHVRTPDGRLDLPLDVPVEMGGPGGPGTNPEQLFAAGYAACFQSALMRVAAAQRLAIPRALPLLAGDAQQHRRRAQRRRHPDRGCRGMNPLSLEGVDPACLTESFC
jgi:hypothetical protein